MASLLPGRRLFPLLLFLSASATAAVTALDKVPAGENFRYVNEGEYGIYPNEYGATYRPIPVGAPPFQLMWYNTTPDAYFVGLRMGTARSAAVRRWVWEANRGRPVREKATLTFGADGDLVLADADGAVAWSTGTANRGVIGLRVLPGGNVVLYDRKGKFQWQSFDHPTDTLLVGQSLPVGGAKRLVSRKSAADGSPGSYTLVMGPWSPILYMNSSSSPSPLPYFSYAPGEGYQGTYGSVAFDCRAAADNVSYELTLNGRVLSATKYGSALSFLRLEPDGDVVVYTYDDRVEQRPWEKTFTLFSEQSSLSPCYKPSRCGSLGVCEDEMCVACPSATGATGWSRSCAPPERRRGCSRGGETSTYYKVAGVENFLPWYTEGVNVTGAGECRRRCDGDCSCRGFFYWEEAGRCWPAPELGSLSRVSDDRHVVYIKNG